MVPPDMFLSDVSPWEPGIAVWTFERPFQSICIHINLHRCQSTVHSTHASAYVAPGVRYERTSDCRYRTDLLISARLECEVGGDLIGD
jgi:hypothetical protein